MSNLVKGLKSLFNKPEIDRELDEELDSYQAASTRHKQSLGLTPEAAQRAAKAEIGSRNAVKHQVWTSRWESTLDSLFQDTRLSLRSLLKSPGFTIIALLSLALGIGANTAIFTLIHQVLLRNLPVTKPEQLVTFGKSESGGVLGGVDLGFFDQFPWYFARQLQAQPGPFQGIAAYGSFSNKASIRAASATSNTPAILAPVNLVSGNYFTVLGAQPFLGRAITPEDDANPGTGAVVVLSHHFWQQFLSEDPAILGKILTINSTPFTVIGVMPESFHGIKLELEPPDLWTPISMQAQIFQQPTFLTRQGPYFLHLFARLGPDAAGNKSGFAAYQNWLDQQLRNGIRANEGTTPTPDRQQEINRATVTLIPAAHGVSEVGSQYGDSLKILMAITALVLLIACANLANFLLARAATRQREIATRLALGSSRFRILRQSLIETLLLSLLGGILGLTLAFAATRALIAFVARDGAYTALSPIPDVSVLLFTFGVSLATGLLFGLAPALTSARTGAAQSLSSNARTTASSRSSRLWPKTLVTAQVMLSLLLLVGAGLFLRTLQNLQNLDYGFERTHLLVAAFDPKLAGYKPSQLPALHQQLLERLNALPGVRSSALSVTPPISFGQWSSTITVPGYTPAPKEDTSSILNRVSGQYFETTATPIASGRAIANTDSATSLKVAVVNETLARHFFPKGDALGRSIKINIDSVAGPWQVVGIARDTKVRGPRDPQSRSILYLPLAQIPAMEKGPEGIQVENNDRYANTLLVRTTGDPAQSIADLRRTLAQVDPNLTLLSVHTIQEQLDSFVSHETLISRLTTIFSALALLLAAIGLYGVMSYNVVRRTNEIGIRLALGAQTKTVLWMVLKESLILLAIGTALGLPLTLATTRLIKEQLYGLSPLDPLTFAAAILVVSAMTVLAAWLPARSAAKVNPMQALRCD